MSGDIESLLRTGLADIADAAPVYEDPGLAEAAIAGAGRIRRRRRVSAAASGASLLVLGAVAFTWQPWTEPEPSGGLIAGDTSTDEAQSEFDMEFVIETAQGYEILNQDGDNVPIGEQYPTSVSRLDSGYLVETDESVVFVDFEGFENIGYDKAEPWVAVPVSRDGTQFALVTPDTEYVAQEMRLVDPANEDESQWFSTSVELELADWSATTVVFRADLWSVTGGSTSSEYMFNDDHDWGLESVADAGFEAVAVTDMTDPNHVCVADLDPMTGTAGLQESCGWADSEELLDRLVESSGDEAAPELLAQAVEWTLIQQSGTVVMDDAAGREADIYESFYAEGFFWSDPHGRWQAAGEPGAESWQLMDLMGDEPQLTELELPAQAIMPVLRYTS